MPQRIIPARYGWMEEQEYYTATNAAFGTGLAFALSTAFSDTVAALVIRNNGGPAQRRLVLDYIKATVTVVPASATAGFWGIKTDFSTPAAGAGQPVGRASAGTALVASNPYIYAPAGGQGAMGPSASQASVLVTPTVAAATTNVQKVIHGQLRSVIPAVGDTYLWTFGGYEKAIGSESLALATAVAELIPCPPCVLLPQGVQAQAAGGTLLAGAKEMLLHLWFPGNAVTAASFEWDVGWMEISP